MENKYYIFVNTIFCRRVTFQIVANQQWKDIKVIMNENDVKSFETEWKHYMLNETYIQKFSEFLKLYVEKYFKK